MISLRQLTLRRGRDVLLDQADVTIFAKQRIGIVGANGCGKSSLFSLLLGDLHAEQGDCDIPRQLRFAHVAQETPALAKSAIDYVLDGDKELRQLQTELAAAEDAHDGEKIALLHDKLSVIQGYSAISRASQLLTGLGFAFDEHTKPVSAFSGGWRVRLNLASALMARSDVLLLDEPTNHLDLDTVLWLEQWLKQYQGTLLLISHDRDFLDQTINHIIHFDHKKLKLYTGHYSSFEKQRAEQLALQQASFEKQQRQIAHMQAFVNRFKAKATKAKQAQSRLKAIERMALVSAVHMDSPFSFQFEAPKTCSNPLIAFDGVTIAYGEQIVLSGITMSISPKDRLAILGPNGAGKSSFIKCLAGEIAPAKGMITSGAGVTIGYFAQHQIDHLSLQESPLDHLKRSWQNDSEQSLRTYLGSYGFVGDDVFAPVSTFSGGEKSRLALALLVKHAPSLLLLDEPTNHLDMEMRHALSAALQEYEGAMIIVSHDRFLLRSTVDKFMLAASGKLSTFDGDLNDYEAWLIEYRKESALTDDINTESVLSKKEIRQLEARAREKRRPLLEKIKKVEQQIIQEQNKLNDLESKLTDPMIYESSNKLTLQALIIDQAQYKKNLQQLEDDWLELCEARDRED